MSGSRGTGTLCPMKTVDLVYFNAGGGHRAAALALEQVIRQQGRPWQVRLLNLTQVLDPQGHFRAVTGFEPEDLYNKRLARGWTLGLAQELKLLQAMIRLAHSAIVERLQQHWLRSEPDLVVSLIPNFNRALFESLASALPGVPFATVLTDMADLPPSFWIEPGQAQHLVCGTAHAAAQARAGGYREWQIHRTSGMILRPDFYRDTPIHRGAERARIGLDADTPVGLVLFGGHGSAAMKRIAWQLPETPLILMCGKNAALAETLRALPAAAPRVIVEFTPDVAYWMRLADFFIGKPGPGSLSEAVHSGLPVIVTRNAWTMPQERWNTDWVRQHRLGIVRRSFGTVQAAVDELLARLPELRTNVRRLRNRAVFEVPEILAGIIAASELPQPWPSAPVPSQASEPSSH